MSSNHISPTTSYNPVMEENNYSLIITCIKEEVSDTEEETTPAAYEDIGEMTVKVEETQLIAQQYTYDYTDYDSYECSKILENPNTGEHVKSSNINNDSSKVNSCDHCEKELFPLQHHMSTHTGEPYKCNECEMFYNNSSLQQHTKIPKVTIKGCNTSKQHTKFLTGKKPYTYNHTKFLTGKKPYICNQCEKTFYEISKLQEHMKTHALVKTHACNICHTEFTERTELLKHKKTHTNRHLCNQCHMGFDVESELQRHMNTHNIVKKHVCDICQRGYPLLSKLQRHLKRVHNDKPYYKCTTCYKNFLHSSSLKLHMKVHTENIPLYKCSLCNKKYFHKSSLNNHEARVHLG